QLRRRRIGTETTWPAALTTATTGRAINKLAMIRADLVSRDVVDERRRTTIAEAIALQFITLRTTLSATGATAGPTCFQIKHLAIDTRLKVAVLPFWHARNRNYSLSQTVEIDLHSHRRTWPTRSSFTAATTFAGTAGLTGTRARLRPPRAGPNTAILIT